jgi:hypothetical protein
LYFIPLYLFWIGVVPYLFGNRTPSVNYVGASVFAFGIIFPYIIANIYEKRGNSWWKIFLLSGFLTTGLPIVGIIWIIISKTNKNKSSNYNEKNENIKTESFNNINYKDILIKNGLDEYIELFEKNRLNDIEIIIDLTENDYEKLGIELMGDRKRLLKIFSKNEIDNFYIEYLKENEQNVNVIGESNEIDNIPEGKTNVIIKRNCATASLISMEIKIDDKNKLNLYNDSSESVILNNGSHSIIASFGYDCKSETLDFVTMGKDIIFNIIPKNINEIIIEKME